MLINDEVDDNFIVFIDVKFGENLFIYIVECNGGFVNSVMGKKVDIFIEVLRVEQYDFKRMRVEELDSDLDDEMED